MWTSLVTCVICISFWIGGNAEIDTVCRDVCARFVYYSEHNECLLLCQNKLLILNMLESSLGEDQQNEPFQREQRQKSSFVRIGKRSIPDIFGSEMGEKRGSAFLRIGKNYAEDMPMDDNKRMYLRLGKNMPLAESGNEADKRGSQFLRIGKKSLDDLQDKRGSSFLRIGKRGSSFLRIGKKSDNLDGDSMLSDFADNGQPSHFVNLDDVYKLDDKRASMFLRIGKRSDQSSYPKRVSSFVRIGKRPSSFLRIGKKDVDEKRASSFLRIGKKNDDESPKRASSFLRIGKSTGNEADSGIELQGPANKKAASSFVRIGKASSFLRIGKKDLPKKEDAIYVGDVKDMTRGEQDIPLEDSFPEASNNRGFVRIAKRSE